MRPPSWDFGFNDDAASGSDRPTSGSEHQRPEQEQGRELCDSDGCLEIVDWDDEAASGYDPPSGWEGTAWSMAEHDGEAACERALVQAETPRRTYRKTRARALGRVPKVSSLPPSREWHRPGLPRLPTSRKMGMVAEADEDSGASSGDADDERQTMTADDEKQAMQESGDADDERRAMQEMAWMSAADEASFLRELHDQCWDMLASGEP